MAEEQQNAQAQNPQDTYTEAYTEADDFKDQAEFDEGFYLDEEAEKPGEAGNKQDEVNKKEEPVQVQQEEPSQAAPQQVQPPQQPQQPEQPQPVQPVQPVQTQEQQPLPQQQPQSQPQQPQQPQQAKTVEIDEALQDEFENLRKLSPDAARLAETDTSLGARMRKRLADYGAEHAYDLAAREFDRWQAAKKTKADEERRIKEATEAHNRHFMETWRQEIPDYYQMCVDPKRASEFQATQKRILDWIGTKPYAEGARLMEIAKSSQDPKEVSGLIKQFYKECGSQPSPERKDPTGAMAVPNRGVSVPPPSIGSQDSFDDGWDISEREESKQR